MPFLPSSMTSVKLSQNKFTCVPEAILNLPQYIIKVGCVVVHILKWDLYNYFFPMQLNYLQSCIDGTGNRQ